MPIKNKITPEIKSKFITAANKTKKAGKEHGFYLCSDDKENISPSRLTSGDSQQIKLEDPIIACKGKKIQGDFHTHSYFEITKNISKLAQPGTSDKDIKKLIINTHDEYKKELGIKELTLDSPSPKDLLNATLHGCVGISKGTTCVTSDMGNDKVECWTPKNIPYSDCQRAYDILHDNKKERKMVGYEKWMIPLFDIETIDLKSK